MIPASGAVSASNVNTELARGATSNVSLNDPGARLLTTNAAVQTLATQISMQQLRGHSGFGFSAVMKDQGGGKVGAIQGDGVNPSPLGTISSGTVPIREIWTADLGFFVGVQTWVRMNVPQPFSRFWALGVWTGAGAFIGALPFTSVSVTDDQYASSGWIGVGWAPTVDFRSYVGQTLNFVFFVQ